MIEAAEKAGVLPKSSSETQFASRQGWWARISNENNQRTWKFISGGIAAVVPCRVVAFTFTWMPHLQFNQQRPDRQ